MFKKETSREVNLRSLVYFSRSFASTLLACLLEKGWLAISLVDLIFFKCMTARSVSTAFKGPNSILAFRDLGLKFRLRPCVRIILNGFQKATQAVVIQGKQEEAEEGQEKRQIFIGNGV